MHCKLCSTRLGENVRFCPNCGNDAGALSLSGKDTKPKVGRMARLPVRARKVGEPELELARPADPGDSSDSSSSSGPVRTAPRKAAGPALVVPEPASVREMLGGRPELLEAGLRVHTDAQGKPVGVEFSTEVGDVDLLGRDAAGSYVVVMVAAQGQGEDYIAEVLQRIGWVRKHLATGSEKVRGILLMDQPPESLSYAAAAVADTVTLKTYRMSLSFEDLRI
ncbi:MAG TPA: hypothetical protein VII72_04185 [Myxococcota bacterium]|jgi:hypothetical protein